MQLFNFECFHIFVKKQTKQVLTLSRSQCIGGIWVLTGCTPTAFHTEALVPQSRPQVEAVSNLKNQLGKEGNLSSTWCD